MGSAAQSEKLPPLHNKYKSLMDIGCALLASVAALCLIRVLQPILHGNHPYLSLCPVIILAAWLWGPVAAGIAALVGWLGVWYWFVPPYGSFAVDNPADILGLLGFLLVAVLIVVATLDQQKRQRRFIASARTARSSMQTLLSGYLEAACRCEHKSTHGGHQLTCPAHPNAPTVLRAERALRMLQSVEGDLTGSNPDISIQRRSSTQQTAVGS